MLPASASISAVKIETVIIFVIFIWMDHLIASALGGEPTPPGTLSGAEVRKKS